MTAAVIGALTGIIGLAIGRFWDIRSEVSRWRRDQRVRAYENLAGAYYSLREALRKLAMSQPGSEACEEAESNCLETAADWNREVIAALLHGSPAVVLAVQQLDHEIVDLFQRVSSRSHCFTISEVQTERAPLQKAMQSYVEAVRKEFKRPAVKVDVIYIGSGDLPVAPKQGPVLDTK